MIDDNGKSWVYPDPDEVEFDPYEPAVQLEQTWDEYVCCHCKEGFKAPSGPTICPTCEHVYVLKIIK